MLVELGTRHTVYLLVLTHFDCSFLVETNSHTSHFSVVYLFIPFNDISQIFMSAASVLLWIKNVSLIRLTRVCSMNSSSFDIHLPTTLILLYLLNQALLTFVVGMLLFPVRRGFMLQRNEVDQSFRAHGEQPPCGRPGRWVPVSTICSRWPSFALLNFCCVKCHILSAFMLTS